ncbi:MAG TPA: peroxiredoxin [Alphaproteobacteria bacterium]|nr:peroxiredoxin [Alphaproteobacteria bacterium]
MIKVGDSLPAISLKRLTASGIEEITLKDRLKGKKVILFAVPGAFTPTCSQIHLPSFVKQVDALKSKGIDEIICVAVNDPFVLDVWEKVTHAHGKITILSDGNGEFTKAMGMTLDASGLGLGARSQRYVAVVEDGIVKSLEVEPHPTQCTITCADEILKQL